ncbi:MAG TPA: hypothetical protein DCE78_07025, partial [Bacteroidetes bacterium]|nr:hypothetical protein [Bacteroidota bacterium]
MIYRIILFCLTLLIFGNTLIAQPTLVSDRNSVLNIPDIVALDASATHMYVLSESEGLIVFRTNSDTLQYLFTSEGMQQRGHTIFADARFAYQYGDRNRLTVIEPTSLLGVFSSTILPAPPSAVSRIGTFLYVAMGQYGLGRLSLNSPSQFDSPPDRINIPGFNGVILDVVRMPLQLFALGSNGNLAAFNLDGEDLEFDRIINIDPSIQNLFVVQNKLYATKNSGELYEIRDNGSLDIKFRASEPIDDIIRWENSWIIRTVNSSILLWDDNEQLHELRNDASAGNFITYVNQKLWLSNYDELSSYHLQQQSRQPVTSGDFKITPIESVVVPFPRAVLIPLSTSNVNPNNVRFQYSSKIDNATIEGHGFYWQPRINQTGVHAFTISAVTNDGRIDSTSFTVDIRSFNSPPRFYPTRPITIMVDEHFTLPIKASDPDGSDPDLIRYHGVDLPDGASISERTGMFNWTPDRRQV